MQRYDEKIEEEMKTFYESLNEKDKRRYAGVEALNLGRGGQVYMEEILGCDRNTIAKGIRELESGEVTQDKGTRIRREGGGRKRSEDVDASIEVDFLNLLASYTAGDPMNESVKWTNLSPKGIVQRLNEKRERPVGLGAIGRLLHKHGYRRRQIVKKTMKEVAHRNEQFDNIRDLKAQYRQQKQVIISIDTKKKELLGDFYRAGRLYTQGDLEAYDHDFPSFAHGKVIPHGIYDLTHNLGFITLGNSHDTADFACDSLRLWWHHQGRHLHPDAHSLLILCDGGGSNSSRHYVFKKALQDLADDLDLTIRIAHYPPYTSKYNPADHRLFPHVTRACQGMLFRSLEQVKALMEQTQTQQGLRVCVHILDQLYETGHKVTAEFKNNLPILFDDFLPQWNYRAVPSA